MNDFEIQRRYKDHYILDLKNKGASRELKGNVVFTVLFIDEVSYKWSEAQRIQFKYVYNEAMSTILRESKLSNNPLNIRSEFGSLSMTNTKPIKPSEWRTKIAALLGVPSIKDFQEKQKQKYRCDEAPIVFAILKKGLSYAQVMGSRSSFSEEFSVVDYHDTKEVIIHEVLHQFGASDFYIPDVAAQAARMYLPDSIMVDGKAIDTVTRYLIGWTKEISEQGVMFLEATKNCTLDDFFNAQLGKKKITPIPPISKIISDTSNASDFTKTTTKATPKIIKDTSTVGDSSFTKTKKRATAVDIPTIKKPTFDIPITKKPNPLTPFKDVADIRANALDGHPYACFLMGWCYSNGIIVERDIDEAIRWYKKGTESQMPLNYYSYSCMLATKSELKECEKAELIENLQNARQMGHIWACTDCASYYIRGKYFEKNPKLAIEYYLTAARRDKTNKVLDSYVRACLLSHYIPELNENLKEVYGRYNQSCNNGDALANRALGKIYQDGVHAPKDLAKSVQYYLAATLSEDFLACFEVGYCYEYGLGVAVNKEKSRYYYDLCDKYAKKSGINKTHNDLKVLKL